MTPASGTPSIWPPHEPAASLWTRLSGGSRWIALIAVPAAVAVLAAVIVLAPRDRSDARATPEATASGATTIEARIAALKARTQVPGSVLACLNASLGAVVDAGCERTIFASPETIAAASAFAADRLSLLADSQNYAGPRSPQFDRALDGLRRTVELDRFGLLANQLAVQQGCTPERCDHLALLRDPTRVQKHLQQRTFDGTVARYAAGWHGADPQAVANAAPGASAQADGAQRTASTAPAPSGRPLPDDYVLPSSDSIPAISIMNSEPARERPRAATTLDAPPLPRPAPNAERPAAERAAPARPRSRDGTGAPLSLAQ